MEIRKTEMQQQAVNTIPQSAGENKLSRLPCFQEFSASSFVSLENFRKHLGLEDIFTPTSWRIL